MNETAFVSCDPTPPAARLARLRWCFAAASALALAGCLDGGSTPPPPPPAAITEVPGSAFASVEALNAFALDQTSTANTVETTEPLGLDQVGDAPTSDTTEPAPLP